jgi:DtxR family Mn-dependent transcriptional regulator
LQHDRLGVGDWLKPAAGGINDSAEQNGSLALQKQPGPIGHFLMGQANWPPGSRSDDFELPGGDPLNRQAIEDYLKTIYELAEVEEPVSTTRVAEARRVKASSATNMMQKLARLGLVAYEKHRGVILTPEGQIIALEVIRHHRLVELYLTNELGYSWDEVHEEAELLEHVLSEKLAERMATVLGDPQFDPHGHPIPGRDGRLAVFPTRPMSELSQGAVATVSRVNDDSNAELLRYLDDLGIRPGTQFTLLALAPFEGPLTIKVDQEQKIVGRRAADSIYVKSD